MIYPNQYFFLLQVSSSGVTLSQYKGNHDNDNDIDQGVFEDQSLDENPDDETGNAKNGVGRKYIAEHYPHYTIVDGMFNFVMACFICILPLNYLYPLIILCCTTKQFVFFRYTK